MKNLYSLFLLFLLISCSTTQYYQSQWYDVKENAPAAVFNEPNSITVSVENDADFLYIELFSNTQKSIEKIGKLGLSLWISEGTNPQKQYGIHYPIPYKDTQGKVALEGFTHTPLLPMNLTDIAPLALKGGIQHNTLAYKLKIPFDELNFNGDKFTIYICSFASGKEEYLSGMTSTEAIERRIDVYKANPQNFYNPNELIPFFHTFQLAKMPNKNLSK